MSDAVNVSALEQNIHWSAGCSLKSAKSPLALIVFKYAVFSATVTVPSAPADYMTTRNRHMITHTHTYFTNIQVNSVSHQPS